MCKKERECVCLRKRERQTQTDRQTDKIRERETGYVAEVSEIDN